MEALVIAAIAFCAVAALTAVIGGLLFDVEW